MFFDSFYGLLRVLVVGCGAYAAVVTLLRVSGKRTLAKLNAFDLVVTVALGSTLATVLLTSSVALAEGVLALALLVALQFALARWSSGSPRTAGWVKSEPVVLLWQGGLLPDELRRERVTAEEVRQALRQQGIGSLEEAAAVVLETDGSISVLTTVGLGDGSVLAGVRNAAAADPPPRG